MTAVHRTLTSRCNDIANDVVLTIGRMDEALELLRIWSETYPDEYLQRASKGLIKRCEVEP